MALTLTIGGSNKTSLLVVNTLRTESRLNTRNRASFTLTDTTGAYRPTVGAEVVFADGTTRYFGGFIDTYSESLTVTGNTVSLSYDVECVSYDAICDRRLVAASYESPTQTLSTIVLDIVTNTLSGDGLNTSNVDTGPIIDKVKFNYVPASLVFDELSNLTGYAWWVDESKNLYFKPRAAVAAPFEITTSNAREITITKTPETYRNKQLIRAGVDLTTSRTENFTGNGTQKAWTLAYDVGVAPTTITVGGVGKTIGVKGVDTGKDWYYQLGSPVIAQDDGAAAVGAGVAIAVTYQGQYPILIAAQNDPEIASISGTSGTSGIWESIEERPNLNDDTAALNVARGLLRRYGTIPRRATFTTETAGLRPGQIATITVSPHAVSGSWLIDSVSAQDRNGIDMVWTVEALDGENVGNWSDFFASLAQTKTRIEFRENEVIIYLRPVFERVTCGDILTTPSDEKTDAARAGDASLTSTTVTPENRAGYAQADLSEAA